MIDKVFVEEKFKEITNGGMSEVAKMATSGIDLGTCHPDTYNALRKKAKAYQKNRWPWLTNTCLFSIATEWAHFKNLNEMVNLFFDFYVMVEIYNKTVGTRNTTNDYGRIKILPSRKEDIITDAYHTAISNIKKVTIRELDYSVYREGRHIPVYAGCNKQFRDVYDQICERNQKYKKSENARDLSLDELEEMFLQNWSDKYYGGEKWAMAVKHLKDLINSKTPDNDVYFIDRIMDLQHNTGFILNKGAYRFLKDFKFRLPNPSGTGKVLKNSLDFRFYAKLEDMIPLCSPSVRKIYFANKNYLNPPVLDLPLTVRTKVAKSEKKAKSGKKSLHSISNDGNVPTYTMTIETTPIIGSPKTLKIQL